MLLLPRRPMALHYSMVEAMGTNSFLSRMGGAWKPVSFRFLMIVLSLVPAFHICSLIAFSHVSFSSAD